MYLILMYLIPVTQFLNDVPTSDVSKSVTSSAAGERGRARDGILRTGGMA